MLTLNPTLTPFKDDAGSFVKVVAILSNNQFVLLYDNCVTETLTKPKDLHVKLDSKIYVNDGEIRVVDINTELSNTATKTNRQSPSLKSMDR